MFLPLQDEVQTPVQTEILSRGLVLLFVSVPWLFPLVLMSFISYALHLRFYCTEICIPCIFIFVCNLPAIHSFYHNTGNHMFHDICRLFSPVFFSKPTKERERSSSTILMLCKIIIFQSCWLEKFSKCMAQRLV